MQTQSCRDRGTRKQTQSRRDRGTRKQTQSRRNGASGSATRRLGNGGNCPVPGILLLDLEEIEEAGHHEDVADVAVHAADGDRAALGRGGLADGEKNPQT